jgi:hypothetical protein
MNPGRNRSLQHLPGTAFFRRYLARQVVAYCKADHKEGFRFNRLVDYTKKHRNRRFFYLCPKEKNMRPCSLVKATTFCCGILSQYALNHRKAKETFRATIKRRSSSAAAALAVKFPSTRAVPAHEAKDYVEHTKQVPSSSVKTSLAGARTDQQCALSNCVSVTQSASTCDGSVGLAVLAAAAASCDNDRYP